MSILFLTEGGKEYGRGHITRCEAVAQALTEYWKNSCFFIDAPEAFTVINGGETVFFDWKNDWKRLKNEIERAKALYNIQAIYIDSYHMEGSLLRKLNNLKLPLFIMDDQAMYDYTYGTIINPTISASKKDYKLHDAASLHTGVVVAPLREAFWYEEPLPYLQRKGILVTLGGSDMTDTLEEIASALADYPEEVTVLTSGAFIEPRGSVKIQTAFIDPWQMKNHIKNCRMIVCAGGGTLLEAACCGTPAIVVKLAENQDLNIRAWSQLGFCYYAGAAGEAGLGEHIYTGLKKLEEHIIWRRASQVGSALVDGLGAKRIARLLFDATEGASKKRLLKESFEINGLTAKNYLSCSHDEHLEILKVRNTEIVLKGTISQNRVTEEQHQAFLLMLGNSETSAYWRIYDGNEVIGTVSLTEINFGEGTAVLGYYKDPDCGRGRMGRLLVAAAIEICFNMLGLKRLRAETMEQNIASIKSMEAAGLSYTGTEERLVGGRPEKLLIYEVYAPLS